MFLTHSGSAAVSPKNTQNKTVMNDGKAEKYAPEEVTSSSSSEALKTHFGIFRFQSQYPLPLQPEGQIKLNKNEI
jgi:hypothetical protein